MDTTTVFDRYAVEKRMPLSVPDSFVSHVQVPPGGRILDIGCGDGRFLAFCQEVAPQGVSVGIDVSWIRVQRVAQGGFTVLQADSENLAFASRTFHLVLMIEIIEHTWRPQTVIAESARVLTPDGRLVLTTPNYPVKRVYEWLDYLRGGRSSPADDPTHFSPFSARRIKQLCSLYFTAVESQVTYIPGQGRWPVLARWARSSSLGDWIGHKVLLVCRHPKN